MSIIEILESKRAWYESQGDTRRAAEVQGQMMAMRRAWTRAMHQGLARDREEQHA